MSLGYPTQRRDKNRGLKCPDETLPQMKKKIDKVYVNYDQITLIISFDYAS